MPQPSITEFFKPVKRNITFSNQTKSQYSSQENAVCSKPSQEKNIEDTHTISKKAEESTNSVTVTRHEPIPSSSGHVKFNTLPTLSIPSPVKLNPDEISQRLATGPPRLTPIKNFNLISINSPSRLISTTPPNSPTKLANPTSSPCKFTKSPIKPSPAFAQKPVVRRLFSIPFNEPEVDPDSNECESTNKLPAYQRFHHLINTDHIIALETDQTNGESNSFCEKDKNEQFSITLPLPYKYNILLELFRAVEHIVSIFYNRKEEATLSKLKPGVLELIQNPKLQLSHLMQMLTVLPQAYELKQSSVNRTDDDHDITISPVLDTESMSGDIIMKRRNMFQRSLVRICYEHHYKFLMSLKPPIQIPNGKTVTRWHPKFQLDEVPDVILEKCSFGLPSQDNPTASTSSTVSTSSKARHLYVSSTKVSIAIAQKKILEMAKGNPKLTSQLKSMMNKPKIPTSPRKLPHNEEISRVGSRVQLFKAKHKIFQKAIPLSSLASVSENLLEKIRAREQEKSIRCMTLTQDEIRRREMLVRLPEFVKMVRNAIILEKKSSVPINCLIERVSHSLQFTNKKDTEAHIRLLCTIAGEWLEVLKTSQGEYVKIDKDVDINGILTQIDDLINKIK